MKKKYVMYEALGTWYITTAENHNRYIEDLLNGDCWRRFKND